MFPSLLYVNRHGRFGWHGRSSRRGGDQSSVMMLISDGHGVMQRLHWGDGLCGGVVFASVWVFGAAGVCFTACVGTVDGSIGC